MAASKGVRFTLDALISMANHWPKPMFREFDRCPPKATATRSNRIGCASSPEHAGVSKFALAFPAALRNLYSVLSSGTDGTWRRRSILSWRIRTISIVPFGAALYIRK
jgi:hypothetical protein